MQDTARHEVERGDNVPQIFCWPGEEPLATTLADWLAGPAARTYDIGAALTELRKGARIVVLWNGPEQALVDCVRNDGDVVQALTGWKAAAAALLSQQRGNRRLMILAETASLAATGVGALTARLGLPEGTPPTLPAKDNALGMALARLLLEQDPSAHQLLLDLKSASLAGPDWDAAAVARGVVADFRKVQAARDALAEDLTRSHAASQGRIEALQAALTAAEAAAEAERQTVEAEREHLAQTTRMLDLLRDHVSLSDAELGTQIEKLMAALELARVRKEALDVQHEIQQQLERELAAGRQALVERATQLADAVRNGEAAARLAAERGAELDLLRSHLAVVHAELEPQLAGAKAEAEARRAEVDRLQKALADAGNRLATLEMASSRSGEESALLRSHIELVQQALDDALLVDPAAGPSAIEADKAVSRALATARAEAEERLRLQKELDLMRERTDRALQRQNDLVYNSRLFTEMTKETTAALDEIARMVAAGV